MTHLSNQIWKEILKSVYCIQTRMYFRQKDCIIKIHTLWNVGKDWLNRNADKWNEDKCASWKLQTHLLYDFSEWNNFYFCFTKLLVLQIQMFANHSESLLGQSFLIYASFRTNLAMVTITFCWAPAFGGSSLKTPLRCTGLAILVRATIQKHLYKTQMLSNMSKIKTYRSISDILTAQKLAKSSLQLNIFKYVYIFHIF